MPQIKINLTLFATFIASAASAQFFDIDNRTRAEAYNPALDEHSQRFQDFSSWDAAGRDTSLVSTSESHPFDPPFNIATAMSQFMQPDYKDATVRGMSFALSDYSSQGGSSGYSASTFFALTQFLEVDLRMVSPAFSIAFKLAVPMHGVMSARGEAGGTGAADANLEVQAFGGNGNLVDEVAGHLHAQSTTFNDFNYTASGDWAADAQSALVTLPTGDQRTSQGVELNSFHLLDLGVIQGGTRKSFEISYTFETSATISSPYGLHALSDFSGTGAMTFLGFDEAGNPFTDFTVYPVGGQPVPEPASLAAIGLGIAAFVRRRRK